MKWRIVLGDALHMLRQLPDEAAQCCMTSPPYFGLRDYDTGGIDWAATEYAPMPRWPMLKIPAWFGELGQEPSPEMYTAHIVDVFREVYRVLANDGIAWLNLGDSYAAGKQGRDDAGTTGGLGKGGGNKPGSGNPGNGKQRKAPEGYTDKDLLGIPWRLAFALQADGWILRSDVIWHKPNVMPESVRDRPTKAHEYVFMLTKSPAYLYDIDATREPHADKRVSLTWGERKERGEPIRQGSPEAGGYGVSSSHAGVGRHPNGRNRRSVWTVATRPYSGAHFATFPPDLIEPAILASTFPGALVIDPFCGSGTTGAVAVACGCHFVGGEINPAYIPLAKERIGRVNGGEELEAVYADQVGPGEAAG